MGQGIPDSTITQPTGPVYTEDDSLPSSVDVPLQQLKQERLKGQGGDVYISPRAKATPRATGDFDLTAKVQEFLASDKKVFLLLGDSGAGKSTFNRALEISLWDNYDKINVRIPLFIHLPAIEKPERDLIGERLRKANFTENQILELKLHREFILICDGYDESHQPRNLYMSNQLNQPGEWRAQMVISCRTEYYGFEYKDCFQPTDRNSGGDTGQFQEAIISPFTKEQVQDYIGQYVSLQRSPWRSEDYLQALKQIPNLQDLVKNPFLLKLALEVLPRLLKTNTKFSFARITRVQLYDELVAQWIKRSEIRLVEMDLKPSDRKTFKQMTESGFQQRGITYLKELVTAIYVYQNGNPVVHYSEHRDRGTWKEEFFGERDGSHLLREAIPLTRNGDQYRFIHKSLLEYGLSLVVFGPTKRNEDTEATPSVSRRGNTSSVLSFESPPSTERTATADDKSLLDSPLGMRNLVGEGSILQFLTERVQQEPVFKHQLYSMIERSKTDKKARVAAANAITILVRAGVQFNSADLRNIKIPGADLSFGMFDSAQLEGADLRKVNFRNIWLRGADLRGSQMKGVQFGELQFQEEDSEVRCSAYSPDGKTYAVGLANGDISLYDMSSWNRVLSMQGHSGGVAHLSYSPTGLQIASGGADETIRLWDVASGECLTILIGHGGPIRSIAYSPKGDQIASGSWDKAVRLWNSETGECIHTLEGHSKIVTSVMYSPERNFIASASWDSTVRLWDVDTGDCIHTLKGHGDYVWSLAYSPRGDQIASGSEDKTVRIWDVKTGDCIHTLQGHGDEVTNVVYSWRGDQIASGSADETIRLWGADTGNCAHVLMGHTGPIISIAYSPIGDQMASGSWDNTVRLWDVFSGDCIHTLEGHSKIVTSVAYSPKGDQIASGSEDKTVRLWYADVSDIAYTSQGHSESVTSVAYSPKGDQIASGSQDKTVRLWDVNTGNRIHMLQGHSNFVSKVVYSPTGNQVASGSRDKTVRLWDIDTGDCIHTLQGHNSSVTCVVYSPKGDRIASGSHDKTVRLWEVETGNSVLVLKGHGERITDVVYSPKEDRIASGSWDKTVRLWAVDTGDHIHTLQGHGDIITSVVYSLNGDQIASGSADTSVRLWNADTSECIHILKGHRDSVTSITYSPIGSQIASGSADKTVRLWNVDTGECTHTFKGHINSITSVMYSLKGDQLVSGSLDMTGRLWGVENEECLATIPDFNGSPDGISWENGLAGQYLAAAGTDKSVRRWQIIQEGDEYKSIMRWSSSREVQALSDASFMDVTGLSRLDCGYLSQRGALVQLPSEDL